MDSKLGRGHDQDKGLGPLTGPRDPLRRGCEAGDVGDDGVSGGGGRYRMLRWEVTYDGSATTVVRWPDMALDGGGIAGNFPGDSGFAGNSVIFSGDR